MSTETISPTASVAATSLPQRAVVLPFAKAAAGSAPDQPDQPAAAGDTGDLQAAVAALNQHLAERRTDLNFRVDHDTGGIVVSIVDAQTGTVLRQMPSEEALRIARYIDGSRSSSGLVHQQA